MRRSAAVLGLGLLMGPSAAVAQVLSAHGFGWSSGAFPAALPGDTLNIVFACDQLSPQLGVNLQLEEATGTITAIVKDVQDFGPAALYQCLAGKLWIGRDSSRDHDYGTHPPNLTAPASFLNGSACLVASLPDLRFYFDSSDSSAACDARLGPLTGDCAGPLPPPSPGGHFSLYGAFPLRADAPLGYDFGATITVTQVVLPAWYGLPCFQVTDAQFDVASQQCEVPGTLLRGFRIRGVFTEGPLAPPIDPGSVPVAVWFEHDQVAQSLPAGSLIQQPLTPQPTWTYNGSAGSGLLSKVEFVLEGGRQWTFELCGQGVPSDMVLSAPSELYLELDPTPWYVGRTRVSLQSDCDLLWYRDADPRPCGGLATPAESAVPGSRRPWRLELPQPNPFAVQTRIHVHAADPRPVQLAIYDARGTLVRGLHRGRMALGPNGFGWDGRDDRGRPLPAGVYLCRLRTPESVSARKLVLVK